MIDLSLISFETNNDGMTDSSRDTSFLAKQGDTLTLKFQTREEIIDEQATGLNSDRIPEVTFKYRNENDEEVEREASVVSSSDVNAIDNRWFVATYRLNDTDLGIESDVDYEIEIHDRSGNIKTYADNASLQSSTPPIAVSNTLRIDTKAPDLTLISRARQPEWLYTYLRAFYQDDQRPYGVNNRVYPNVGMPHVLMELQGLPACYDESGAMAAKAAECKSLELATAGAMSAAQFDSAMYDLVNFLAYTAEPYKADRLRIGTYVLLFLVVFFIFAWLLNREYWKDVH